MSMRPITALLSGASAAATPRLPVDVNTSVISSSGVLSEAAMVSTSCKICLETYLIPICNVASKKAL